MKHLFLVLFCLSVFANVKAQYAPEITKAGVLFYQILPVNDSLNKRKTVDIDLLDINYRMAIASNDSVLAETFAQNQPVTVPASHPSFNGIFKQMKKGDRVTIVIMADSFYKHTINTFLPPYLKPTDSLSFFIKVYDIMNEAEFIDKQHQKAQEESREDSINFVKYVSMYQRVKSTNTGLHYLVSAVGTGKQAINGSKVTVKYRGYFMNGKVFESNMQGYTFTLGSKEVIRGWNEGVLLMREGARYKFIIPPSLAYGSSGANTIDPYTSIVFDIELISVE